MRLESGIALMALTMLILPKAGLGNVLTVDDVRSGGIIVFGEFTPRLTGLEVPGLDHRLGMEIWDFIKREIHGKRVRVFTWTTNDSASGIMHDGEGYPFVTILYGKNGSQNLNETLLLKGYARVDEKYLPEGNSATGQG
jgi:hypothetical protein